MTNNNTQPSQQVPRVDLTDERAALIDLYSLVSEHGNTPDSKYHVVTNAAQVIENALSQPSQQVPTQEQWKSLAACMYQAAGAFDLPVRFLDALSAAQRGEAFAHLLDDLLPVVSKQVPRVDLTDEQVEAIWSGLDGKSLIAGESSLNWNRVLRTAFARALLANTAQGKPERDYRSHPASYTGSGGAGLTSGTCAGGQGGAFNPNSKSGQKG